MAVRAAVVVFKLRNNNINYNNNNKFIHTGVLFRKISVLPEALCNKY